MRSCQPVISLCMIVKNEEKNLERCLKSAKDYVDEIIVIDTGSTDNTPQIAKKYGARVFFHEWSKDFAKTRNKSLEYARGKWILVLDADEEIPPETGSSLRKLARARNIEAYTFIIVSPSSSTAGAKQHKNINIRMFKNSPDYKFEGALHEQIKPSILKAYGENVIAHTNLIIYHYGYCQDLVNKKAKTLRNIEILKKMLASNPNDNFSRYNLGVSYYVLGNFEQAIEQFSQAKQRLNTSSGYAPAFFRNYTITLMDYGEYDGALHIVEEGIAHFPDYPDLYFLKGNIMMELGMLNEAQKCFEQCLVFKKINPKYPTTEGVQHYLSHENLSHIFEQMSNLERAVEYQVKSLKFNNSYRMDSFLRLGRLLKQHVKKGEEILAYLLQHFDGNDFKEGYLPLILYEIGEYRLCTDVINQFKENPALINLKAQALLRLGMFKKAKLILAKLPKSFSKYKESLLLQCICDWMQTPPVNAKKQAEILYACDLALAQCCRLLNNHFLSSAGNTPAANAIPSRNDNVNKLPELAAGENKPLQPVASEKKLSQLATGENKPPEPVNNPAKPVLKAGIQIAFQFLVLGSKKYAFETLKALGINDTGKVNFLLGKYAFEQQNFDVAEDLLLNALKHNHKQGEIYYMLSRINFNRHHYLKAFTLLEQAISLEENNFKYYLDMMNSLVQKQILIVKDGFNLYKADHALKKYFFSANNFRKKLQLIY